MGQAIVREIVDTTPHIRVADGWFQMESFVRGEKS